MNPSHLTKIAMLLASFCIYSNALAQYEWLNEHGVKQFSDIAPPGDVPQDRILKQPRSAAGGATPAAVPSDAAQEDRPAPAKAPMTTAEKNAAFNKHKLEKAENDKKAVEEAKRQTVKADNCARAASYLASLKSGIRIANTDSNGERAYLTDEDRAKEEARTQSVVDDCK